MEVKKLKFEIAPDRKGIIAHARFGDEFIGTYGITPVVGDISWYVEYYSQKGCCIIAQNMSSEISAMEEAQKHYEQCIYYLFENYI